MTGVFCVSLCVIVAHPVPAVSHPGRGDPSYPAREAASCLDPTPQVLRLRQEWRLSEDHTQTDRVPRPARDEQR